MDMQEKIYEIRRPGAEVTRAGVADARMGLQLIRSELERSEWQPLSASELARAETVDIGQEKKLGDSSVTLRLDIPLTQAAWNQVEAALQYAEALVRKSGEYDASPVESGGRIIIIANATGQKKIADAIARI